MYLDFSLLLVILTLITGILWALDRWLWEPKRRRATPAGQEVPPASALVDFGRSLFPVILLVLVLRSFIAEPFRIPSGSMMPTLLTGDFILVNKFSYGLRLPVTNQKILAIDEPKRGDVVVFHFPPNPSLDFIKRIIGLPGDVVTYYNKRLYINGEPVPTEFEGPYQGSQADRSLEMYQFKENLGPVEHKILLADGLMSPNRRYTVPDGHYFVMGDNRDNSDDSRRWGFVPERNLVGKAFIIWMNWDSEVMHPQWSRIGRRIK